MSRIIALGSFLLLLAGCTSFLQQEQPAKRHFALEVSRSAHSLPQPVFEATLLVRDFSVAPTFDTAGLVYRMEETTYESDYYNVFLVEPGQLISQETREWLRNANLFSTVIRPGSGIRQNYTLEGHVLSLYGDFAEDRQRAVLRMQFFLIEESNGSPIILQQEYSRGVPLDEAEPKAVVMAYNKALASILSELSEDIRQLQDE